MQVQVEVLRELQGVDQELSEVRRKSQKLEAELAELEAELQRVAGMGGSLAATLEQLQGERRELDQALAVEQENIKRAEGRLPGIKTQKEYVAVLKEIDTAKKLNKELQDRIKAKDEELAAVERDKGEKDADLAQTTARVDARRAEIDAERSGYDQTLNQGGGRREGLLGQLSPVLRKRYQTLIDRRGGIAIVAARKGTCLGCNMQLPPQLFNSLFTTQEIQNCPHCHRLLYLSREE